MKGFVRFGCRLQTSPLPLQPAVVPERDRDDMRRRNWVICLGLGAGLALAGCAPWASEGEWRQHGRDAGEQRFSPLEQITAENVGQLGLAWYHDLDTRRGQEATPIMVDGVLYVSTAWSKVVAFDAKTGAVLWQYDPEVPREWAVRGCCDVVNRGVAVEDGKVVLGTFDGRLVALDAATGKELWEVDTIIDRSRNYTVTGAPRVVKGKVIIGNGGGEFGVRGYVTAYDLDTGKQAWRFFTVPGNPAEPFENPVLEKAAKTWTGEWWKVGGGGTVWDAMAYDEELDLLYIGTGNGSPWNPAVRSPGGGDNLFVSSIVALRPDSGDYVWHYQTTPGDQWDYTATQHMILADLDIGGKTRKVIMQAPKNGFFYVLDRATGAFISAKPYAPVTWADGVDPATGRPQVKPEARYHETGSWQGLPGPLGAHNWHPMAFSPETGLVYIPAQTLGFPYVADRNFQMKRLAVNLGVDLGAAALPSDPEIRKAVKASLQGHLVAWDPVKQEARWSVSLGGPWNGGVLATSGDLVFQGNRSGEFVAYHARTGARLWSADAQTGIVAAPITYSIDGEQYVAVVAGWGGILPLLIGELAWVNDKPQVNRSRVLVYKLGGTAKLPPPYDVARTRAVAPARFGSAATVSRGAATYARFCAGCHGDTAVGGGVLPDLRYSFALGDRDVWDAILVDGALTQNGMVAFASEIDAAEREALRAYIVHRAHESGAVAIAQQEQEGTKR